MKITTLPSIHTNGDKQENLLDQVCIFTASLDIAIEKLVQCNPNGRNYFDAATYEIARAEHKANLQILKDMKENYQNYAIAISDL